MNIFYDKMFVFQMHIDKYVYKYKCYETKYKMKRMIYRRFSKKALFITVAENIQTTSHLVSIINVTGSYK